MKVLITDPCYLKGETEWDAPFLGNVIEVDSFEEGCEQVIEPGNVRFSATTSKTARFGVDSGQFIVIPVDALKHWVDGEMDDEVSHYSKTCTITLGEGQGWIDVGPYKAFVSGTAWGDGSYESRVIDGCLVVNTEGDEDCDECDNDGYVLEDCDDCGGDGYTIGDEDDAEEVECPTCNGDGEIEEDCGYC